MARIGQRLGALAVVFFALTSASATAFPRRVPTEFFGVHGTYLANHLGTDLDDQLAHINSSGIKWVRLNIEWRGVEPNAPNVLTGQHTYNWGYPDQMIEKLANHGIRWEMLSTSTPSWATSALAESACHPFGPPQGTGNYASFMAQVATRYGENGTFWSSHPSVPYLPVKEFEIWNEPNLDKYWCQTPNPYSLGPNPGAYSDLLIAATNAIRGVDPPAKIMVGGLTECHSTHIGTPPANLDCWETGDFLSQVIARHPDLATKVSSVAVHDYGDVAGIFTELGWFRDRLTAAGLGSTPMVLNETGWFTQGSGQSSSGPITETERASRYTQLADHIAHTNCNVSAVAPNGWVTPESNPSNGEDWWGIASPTGGAPYASATNYAAQIALFNGTGATEAPRPTLTYCGTSLPDSDGDGYVDQSDTYPFDPALH